MGRSVDEEFSLYRLFQHLRRDKGLVEEIEGISNVSIDIARRSRWTSSESFEQRGREHHGYAEWKMEQKKERKLKRD